jgi:predicted nucleic acid-binding protein
MARYVIDAVTLLHVLDHDVPIDPGHQLVAPNSIRSEAMQLLLDDVRRGRRTEEDALGIHERMTELKMRVLGDRVSRRTAWKFARQDERNSIRDAEYLAVARLQADALVTVDQALADRAADVVPVAPLSALA